MQRIYTTRPICKYNRRIIKKKILSTYPILLSARNSILKSLSNHAILRTWTVVLLSLIIIKRFYCGEKRTAAKERNNFHCGTLISYSLVCLRLNVHTGVCVYVLYINVFERLGKALLTYWHRKCKREMNPLQDLCVFM